MTSEVPDDITSASNYINNVLISKGYIQQHEALQFWSQQLVRAKDQEMDVQATDTTVFENDRRTLNLINSLLETIDSDSNARMKLVNGTEQAQRTLDARDQQIQRLTTKCDALETQLSSTLRLNQTLEAAKRTLESSNKTLREDMSRMKALQQQSKAQFANELRKKDAQISRVKQRLQDPISRNKPLTGASGTFSRVHNSYTSGQGQAPAGVTTTDSLPALRALSQENSMLYGLAYKTRLVLDNILHYGFKDQKLDLSPDEIDNIESLGYDVSGSDELIVNSARVIRRTTNVTQLGAETAHSLQKLSDQLKSAEMVPITEVQLKDKEISELQGQVETVTANWQRAIKTMDEWKNFRKK